LIFDINLSFYAHITKVTKTAFFHLHNITKIRYCLSKAEAETLIHAFVSSRLDYCNVLFYGLPRCVALKSIRVQNAAARVLTKTRKFDTITPCIIATSLTSCLCAM
ncbi:hypothetical protein LDENG_00182440, partial [Lucifuga dentata]